MKTTLNRYFYRNNNQLIEIFRFLFVGGICFLLDYFLLYAFTEYVGFSYLLSSGVAFTISLIINYFLCAAWVFNQVKRRNLQQCVLFIGSSIIGLGINQLCMWGLVELISMHYMVAKIFAAAIVMVWNYVLKRKAVQL